MARNLNDTAKHLIQILRQGGTLSEKLISTLTVDGRKIAKKMDQMIKDGTSLKKVSQIARQDVSAMSVKAKNILTDNAIEVANYQANATNNYLSLLSSTPKGQLKSPSITKKWVDTVFKQPLAGQDATISDLFKGSMTNFSKTVQTAARNAYNSGETIRETSKIFRGQMTLVSEQNLRRNANALARTSVSKVANAARADTYKANDDIVDRIMYIATLDHRTTDICMVLDSQVWEINDPEAIIPPVHVNCRSTTVPILKGESVKQVKSELTRPEVIPKSKKELDKKGLRTRTGRIRKPSTTDRSPLVRKDNQKYQNYEQWLKKQPQYYQKEILGKKAYEEFSKTGSLKKSLGKATLKKAPSAALSTIDVVEGNRASISVITVNNKPKGGVFLYKTKDGKDAYLAYKGSKYLETFNTSTAADKFLAGKIKGGTVVRSKKVVFRKTVAIVNKKSKSTKVIVKKKTIIKPKPIIKKKTIIKPKPIIKKKTIIKPKPIIKKKVIKKKSVVKEQTYLKVLDPDTGDVYGTVRKKVDKKDGSVTYIVKVKAWRRNLSGTFNSIEEGQAALEDLLKQRALDRKKKSDILLSTSVPKSKVISNTVRFKDHGKYERIINSTIKPEFHAKIDALKVSSDRMKEISKGVNIETNKAAREKYYAENKIRFKASQTIEKDLKFLYDDMDKSGITENVDFNTKQLLKSKKSITSIKIATSEMEAMLGGKLPDGLTVISYNKPRADADFWKYRVNVGDGYKRTVFHEIGHFVEVDDARYSKAAREFQYRKAGTKTTRKLKDITGIAFENWERALEDDYINPYVGKVYDSKFKGKTYSEVVSMGIEKFETIESAALFAEQDPDHFRLILGIILDQRKKNL